MVFTSIGKCAYRVRVIWPPFGRYRDCGRPAYMSYPYAGVSRRPLCAKHAPPAWTWVVPDAAAEGERGTVHMRQSVNGCVTCPRKWSEHTIAERTLR